MARGIAHAGYPFGKTVVKRDEGGWNFLYEHSTTKQDRFDIGDRFMLPDARVFRYGLEHASTGIGAQLIEAGRCCKFTGTMSDGVSASTNRAQVIGDSELRFASQTFALDELRGGYVVVYSAGNTYQQFGIVGNTVCSNANVIVYLDRKITVAVTSTQFCEILPNPYRRLGRDADGYGGFAGVPMSQPAATEYFWIQTWGILWCNPGASGGMGGASGERQVVIWPDGTLRTGTQAGSTHNLQHAGFIVNFDSLGNDGPPFIMLQISP